MLDLRLIRADVLKLRAPPRHARRLRRRSRSASSLLAFA